MASYLASLPADQFPNITAVAGHFIDDDPGQRFELLIDLFVDGLAERAAFAGADGLLAAVASAHAAAVKLALTGPVPDPVWRSR